MHQKETNKIGCDQVRRNLFDFQEKKLSEENSRDFETHLKSCSACSLLYQDFLHYDAIIDQKKTTEINPFISTRIIQALETISGTVVQNFFTTQKRILQPVFVSFLVVLAVFTGYLLMNSRNPHPTSTANRNEMIQLMQSDLSIAELMDEDKIFLINP